VPKPQSLDSFNPATGDLIGSVPVTDPGDVAAVVAEVAQVQPFWAALPFADRSRYLRRAAQVILDELDDLRDLIAREQGKPRTEAYVMELIPTIDALRWIAGHGPQILGDERIAMSQPHFRLKRSKFVHEPLGVVGVIAPWNHRRSTVRP
jgi:acyl-CoA reductase-like NAD-dependent aldehyde dehydrogenase